MPRQSTGRRPVFSASAVMEAIAAELTTIKRDDELTDGDLGRVLGKSEDQAAKYRTGLAEMGVVAYAAGKREWNGRFTGALDRLCVESRPVASDRHTQTSVLKAALALSLALEGDDTIDADDVRSNRATIEQARDALDGLLAKLRPREAA